MTTEDNSGNLLKRIRQELLTLKKQNYTVDAEEQDVTRWKALIEGPADSPYSGGWFQVDIKFVRYPFTPPETTFLTKVYHPNIDKKGKVCVGILKTDQWKPTNTMKDVLMALADLLKNPNPLDPLEADIAHIYTTERKEFNNTATAWTKEYARNKPA
ncbi:hypothetical protein BGZ65_000562 [Modicella reniformis]|uniref:E2 ubiquitin-conjugating enzyme n=1 Tax=Modicella reniformis TaxID=1440133 RepID=A0A9P6MJP1_9FUNG|nr:hypothetical protein BGZ65_000562 [Modicella reniformis]